jgi:hypothetical protein
MLLRTVKPRFLLNQAAIVPAKVPGYWLSGGSIRGSKAPDIRGVFRRLNIAGEARIFARQI